MTVGAGAVGFSLLFLPLLLLPQLCVTSGTQGAERCSKGLGPGDHHFDTCIIGAGPGGLQLGHLLNRKGRNYATFERASTPGSFFERFPIHRQLISVNKRNTGRDNPEFNLRHDWNRLLGNPGVAPLTERTIERFPHADMLVGYLREYAAEQERSGRVFYRTSVDSVERSSAGSPGDNFSLTIRTEGQQARRISCRVVVSAIGLWQPHVPPVRGIDLTVGYEDLPPTGDIFEGKSVAILGLGNAAFETANAAENYANYIHMWPTRVYKWPYASWESRYDGNLRAIRANILDGYMLKSLDLLPLGNQIEATPDRMMMHRCYGDKVCLFTMAGKHHPVHHEYVVLGQHNPESLSQNAALEALDKLGVKYVRALHPIGAHKLSVIRGPNISHRSAKIEGAIVVSHMSTVTDETVEHMMAFRNATAEPLGRPYDVVVRATGWNHNISMYADSATPQLQSNQKFARMTHEYESINVPGLYFAGSLTHGKDRGRAVGGVIKGFRHTAKALFNILEAKYENQRWPCQQYQIPSQVDALMKHVLRRINEAPDLYFMVYTIVDGIFFSESNGAWAAEYCESMPSDYLHTVYADLHRMVVMFGFDGQRRDLEHMINSGIGFEPWIWYWAPDTDNEVHKEVFRLVESAHTTWDGAEYGMWLQWFETKVAQIANGDGQTRTFGAELVPNPRNPKPYQMKVKGPTPVIQLQRKAHLAPVDHR